MKTRLHRLYSRRVADVNVVDEPLDTKIETSQQSTYPAGEEVSDNSTSYHNDDQTRRMQSSGKGVIFAIKPTKEAALSICDEMHGLEIDPDYLHVTLVYLGKDLSPDQIETIKKIGEEVCAAHNVLECKTQGLGIFDHVDEDEGGRPFYASVDALGMAELRTNLLNEVIAAGIEIDPSYDFTPHMTLAYLDPKLVPFGEGSPGVEWASDEVILMNGDEHTPIKLGGDHKEAGLMTDNPAESYHDENTSEDVDLHLGIVEAPYSSGAGPLSIKMQDLPKESVALPDNSIDENGYGPGSERADLSIQRGDEFDSIKMGR